MDVDDDEVKNLPLDQRLVHKQWKVRLEAYEELQAQFDRLAGADDACFLVFSDLELLRKCLIDANVVAQEAAYGAFTSYLRLGGTPKTVSQLRASGVVKAVCEKGLSLNRKGTKEGAIELVLLMVEILDDQVIEDILPHLAARLPKLVVGCVVALRTLVDEFGLGVISPKLLLPVLPKLFGHADRNVRAETIQLTVAIYRWMGAALETQLMDELKPVQQKDLKKEFEKVEGKPEQKRFTRKQQQEIERVQEGGQDEDVVMGDQAVEFDPYEHLEAENVLLKIPAKFEEDLLSPKWKERKEALEEVDAILQKSAKMAPGDYAPLLRLFAKCMKDANIQVVQLAAQGIEYVVKGLQSLFSWASLVVGPMVERTKEKKPLVAQALASALDAVFAVTLLATVLEEAIVGTKNKTPQVKIALANFLQRCLATTLVSPSLSEVEAIMEAGVKLLNDSQEPIRQAAIELIGTLMKITGERKLNPYVDKVDKKRMEKVKAFYDTVEVSVRAAAAKPAPPAPKRDAPATTPASKPTMRPQLALPAKRLATLPAKRANEATKRSSQPSTTLPLRPINPPSPEIRHEAPERSFSPPALNLAEREEFLRLRAECNTMREQLKANRSQISDLQNQIHSITNERDHWRVLLEDLKRETTNATLTAKQRETQLMRAQLELEDARYKIAELERLAETERDVHGFRQLRPPRVVSGDLSNRVNRLSIDLNGGQPATNFRNLMGPMDVDDSNELWRRAAEVTSQLKARIEKMKARSRTNNFG